MNEIEKIKYHIELLSEALDPSDHPIASLIISNDWIRADLDAAHDIFERYDKQLEMDNSINWHNFEKAFLDRFGINYQGLKSIVLAFFRNGQWTDVCTEYALKNQCIEFSEIIGDQRNRHGSILEERVAAIFRDNKLVYSRDFRIEGLMPKKVDFLVQFPRAKVAIEVKRQLNKRGVESLETLAQQIRITGVADELWLVLEHTSVNDMAMLSKIEQIKIFSIEDLRNKLRLL
jgi:hypothetical protein